MVTKNCAECGKTFEVDDSKRNWHSVVLCSPECQHHRTNRKSREKYIKQEWPQKMVCSWCGVTFELGGPHQKKANRKYCTRDCYLSKKRDESDRELQKRLQSKICLSCGKAFIPSKWIPDRQKYCSATCFRREAWKRNGEPRKTNRDFARIRRHILKDLGRTCQLCGSGTKPEVHHLDGDHKNNAYENLTVFCRQCHNASHRVFLVKINEEWKVSGKIFEILALTGNIEIVT